MKKSHLNRSADYTIKGFLYQFHKTIREILCSDDESVITVEGIVEDIDIKSLNGIKAIQCKYHEANNSFNISNIFKPVLEMMSHYHSNNTSNIEYLLFAYFPTVDLENPPEVSIAEFNKVLETNNSKLKKTAAELKDVIDLDEFNSRFTLEFGVAFDDLVEEVKNLFKSNGILNTDIDTLVYPNALQIIAELSIKHNPDDRKITKQTFLEELKAIRTTAISFWTMALQSKEALLKKRREQLKGNLSKNARLRYFVIDNESLEDFHTKIVNLIHDYLEKYHFKTTHTQTPIFCIKTTREKFLNINVRLYKKGVIATDGHVGDEFMKEYFFRDPLVQKKTTGETLKREFNLRLLHWDDGHELLNVHKCDDLFTIGKIDLSEFDATDVNIEHFPINNLKEISYILGVSENYD